MVTGKLIRAASFTALVASTSLVPVFPAVAADGKSPVIQISASNTTSRSIELDVGKSVVIELPEETEAEVEGDERGAAIGTWTILVGAVVLLLWIPLHLRPGIGTGCNVVLIGLVLDAALGIFPQPQALSVRWTCLVVGVGLNAIATGAYVGAGLGPGPRDGLMVGLAARGHSIRGVRTSIELTVLAAGIALGGTAGIGTVVFAALIGPLVHVTLPLLSHGEMTNDHARTKGKEIGCASD